MKRRKRLVRLEVVLPSGEVKEIAQAATEEDNLLTANPDEYLDALGRLHAPDPYPPNTKAFFTRRGLHRHRTLINLWRLCLPKGAKIVLRRGWYTKNAALYAMATK